MYNSRQIQCMQAMGLVPWVRRTAAAVTDPLVQSPVIEQTTAQGAPAHVESADPIVLFSGDTDSPLLLIFNLSDSPEHWPLNKADDALLDGMLRAIGMSKASVCSCAIVQGTDQQGQSLAALCETPRKHFLYFSYKGGSYRGSSYKGDDEFPVDAIDPIPMTQASASGSVIGGWRLPSLEVLRAEPERKRQAWITLKQLRAALDLS